MKVFLFIKSLALTLVIKHGYSGIFILSISAGLYQPIGPDLFIVGKGGLGFNPYLAAVVALGGTVLGALVGYALGHWLRQNLLAELIQKWKTQFQKAQALLSKYGLWAVAIAGFGPVPLTQVCWLAGIGRMPLKKFILGLCMGLVPRFFGEAAFGYFLGQWIK